MSSHRFAINARFLTRPASGVDRVAMELIVALAGRADVAALDLLHPEAETLHDGWLARVGPEVKQKIRVRPLGTRQGHVWEQVDLARALPDQILLSLCSTGPVMRRKQAVMIHDAQVWDAPTSYSRAFRLAYRLLLPMVARTAAHVLTVSDFAKGRIETLGIVPRNKSAVVFNGADHLHRVQADPSTLDRHRLTNGGYFLAIGNLAPHKNLKLLTEAARDRSPGAPDLIVAGGMNSRVFANADLRDGDGVRFIGRVSDGELKALYEGALALAFPSLTEGFGLPPVEAMLCSCPVIATTGGAVPEVCGDAALYVNPTDRPGWTAAMIRMADDADLRAGLIAAGLRRAAHYTWANAAESVVKAVA